MKKRAAPSKEWIGEMHRVRAKRDLSKVFRIPYLDVTSPMCDQPSIECMSIELYDYQRRAVARMMAIERGVGFDVGGNAVQVCGGVACDAVGA